MRWLRTSSRSSEPLDRARPAAKNATGPEATGAAATQVPPSRPRPISGFRLLVRITLRRLGKLVRGHRNQPR